MNVRKKREVLYRRSPHIVLYWRDKEFLIENYACGTRITAAPIVFQILQLFESWHPLEDVLRDLGKFDSSSVRKAITKLTKYHLLERSDRPPSTKAQAMDAWKQWNPAAGFFHFSTKDTRYRFRFRNSTWERPARPMPIATLISYCRGRGADLTHSWENQRTSLSVLFRASVGISQRK